MRTNRNGEALKNVATLTVAEYVDRPGLHVAVRYEHEEHEANNPEFAPLSFVVMHNVWESTLGPATEASNKEGTTFVPGSDTPQ